MMVDFFPLTFLLDHHPGALPINLSDGAVRQGGCPGHVTGHNGGRVVLDFYFQMPELQI